MEKKKKIPIKWPKSWLKWGRGVAVLILAGLQIFWLYVLIRDYLAANYWSSIIYAVVLVVMIIYLVNKDDNPEYRISWLVLIALLPVFGGLMYILFGDKRPTMKMSRQLETASDKYKHELGRNKSNYKKLKNVDKHSASLARYIEEATSMPVCTNTKTKYYPNGESALSDVIDALEQAEDYIFIEFFIVSKGKFLSKVLDVLERKAASGVDVRFIYDDFGCLIRLPDDFDAQLEEKGIKALKFNPVTFLNSLVVNTRDHRKMIVVDGKVAFTGGINLADEYINEVERFGYWKDNLVRMEGSAVWNLTYTFLEMWNAFRETDDNFSSFYVEDSDEALSEGFVQPFVDSPLDKEAVGENVYINILYQATDYVYIYTPYLVISHELQNALTSAAKRGVDVRIITPGIPDKKLPYRLTRSYYSSLIEEGVRIYEYSPGFLHAKTFVSDDTLVSLGTINLDFRSLYLHFELGVNFYHHPIVEDIKEDFAKTMSQSTEITEENKPKRGFFGRILDAILRLAAPLF